MQLPVELSVIILHQAYCPQRFAAIIRKFLSMTLLFQGLVIMQFHLLFCLVFRECGVIPVLLRYGIMAIVAFLEGEWAFGIG